MNATKGMLAKATSLRDVLASPKATSGDNSSESASRASVSGGVLKAVMAVARKEHGRRSSSSVLTKSATAEAPRIEDISALLGQFGIVDGPVRKLPAGAEALSKTVHASTPADEEFPEPRKHESPHKKKKSLLKKLHSADGTFRSPITKKESRSSKREGRKLVKGSSEDKDGKLRKIKKKSSQSKKEKAEEKLLEVKKHHGRRESRVIRKIKSLTELQQSMDLSQLESTKPRRSSRRRTSFKGLLFEGNNGSSALDMSVSGMESAMDASTNSRLQKHLGRSMMLKSTSLQDDKLGASSSDQLGRRYRKEEDLDASGTSHHHKRRQRKGSAVLDQEQLMSASAINGMDSSANVHNTKLESRRRRRKSSSELDLPSSAINGMDSSNKSTTGRAKRESRRQRKTNSTSGEMDGSSNRREGRKSTAPGGRRSPMSSGTPRARRTRSVEDRKNTSPTRESPRGVADALSPADLLPPVPDLDGKAEERVVETLAERRQRRKVRNLNGSSRSSLDHQSLHNLNASSTHVNHRGMDSRAAIRQKELKQRIKNAHHHVVDGEHQSEAKQQKQTEAKQQKHGVDRQSMMDAGEESIHLNGEESLRIDGSFWDTPPFGFVESKLGEGIVLSNGERNIGHASEPLTFWNKDTKVAY